MTRCGNIGKVGPTIFHSFGVKIPEAIPFRDTLKPPGIMFNDALPDEWTVDIAQVIKLEGQQRQQLLTARYAQAMAELSTGEVCLVAPAFAGAYTIPLPGPGLNTWQNFEFPTMQRNPHITKVTEVVNQPRYDRSTGWEPNKPQYSLLPPSNADTTVSFLPVAFHPSLLCDYC